MYSSREEGKVAVPGHEDAGNPDVAPRPGRPRDAKNDTAILEATTTLLFDKGYVGLTIDGVAAAAGVSRPTIYRRWSSKAELVIAALAHRTGLAVPVPNTGSVRKDLIAVQRHQIKEFNNPHSRRVTAGLVADVAADSELADLYLAEYATPRRASVWRALQRGVDRGELRADIDFAFVSDLLIGPLFMRSVVWGQPLDPKMAKTTVDVVLAAFAG
jgi:AcrR family transcriptional regulator